MKRIIMVVWALLIGSLVLFGQQMPDWLIMFIVVLAILCPNSYDPAIQLRIWLNKK